MVSTYSLFFIAAALSLDAFGVALSIGFNNFVKTKNRIIFSFSFGFFQFLFSLTGAYAGDLFNHYVASIPNVIGGIIIAATGAFMLQEGCKEKNERFFLKARMYFILGISVSIDALVVGFSVLSTAQRVQSMIEKSIFIGMVTFVFSITAFYISLHLKRIELIQKYSDYIGGVILILFGLKMALFH